MYCLQKDFDFQQGMSKVMITNMQRILMLTQTIAPNQTFDIWLLLDAPLGGRFTLDMIRHATIKFTRTKMLDNTPCVVKQVCDKYDPFKPVPFINPSLSLLKWY